MKQKDYKVWLEYSATMGQPRARAISQEKLRFNLEQDRIRRQEATLEQGRFFVKSPLRDWEERLALIAITNCKSKKEWQNEEAKDMCLKATGTMTHKSAGELLDRYRDKIQRIYQTETVYNRQIKRCEEMISTLKRQISELEPTNRKRALRSAQNKLKHWRERLMGLQCQLAGHLHTENRLEQKSMKWLGITEKIKIANIRQEIRQEKLCAGNKYGFNPLGQSRETAEIMFTD